MTNSGLISAGNVGINNQGNLGEADGTPNSGPQSGFATGGIIGVLTNSGTIAANDTVIRNGGGSIGSLSNSGLITVTSAPPAIAIRNFAQSAAAASVAGGTIGVLNNSGVITANRTAISNEGVIGTLTNSGTISSTNGINGEGETFDGIRNHGR